MVRKEENRGLQYQDNMLEHKTKLTLYGLEAGKVEDRGLQSQEYSWRTVQPDKMIRKDEGQNLTFEAWSTR